MSNSLTFRFLRFWIYFLSVQMMGLAINSNLLAQFFTRVTDVGPISTDAFLSTGGSWNDINNDGWPDMFALGETGNHFYLNNGDSTFSALSSGHFLTPLGVGNIGIWADYDNDGDQDMFLGNFVTVPGGNQMAPNVLYRNSGPPLFEMEVVDIGNDLNSCPSASWIDYDQDGDVDLFSAGAITSQNGSPTQDLFYRNDGGSVFSRIENLPFLKFRTGFGTHDTWVDYDGDGDSDLYVVNWTFPNELYKSLLIETGNPNRFEPITTSGLTSDGSIFDIGASWGDYDNDGDFDVFFPIINNPDRLYRNNGDGTFSQITNTPIGSRRSAIGVWGDYDNDGDLDLYAGSNSPALYRNEGGGTFTTVGSEAGDILIAPPAPQAGNWGDYDNDGDLDLYILTYAIPPRRTGVPQPNYLIRNNQGNMNHWLEIQCQGTLSNKSAIGAKIKAKAIINGSSVWQVRYISGGATAFVFNGELRAHLGLGDAVQADSLVIKWPSGIVQVLENVAADQMLTVTEEIPDGFIRANFYADETSASGDTELMVTYSDVSLVDPNTPVTSWEWDFENDGFIDATVPNPTWTYMAGQDTSFSVLLRISNGSSTSVLLREDYISFEGITTSIDAREPGIPNSFRLEQNYPNPFNPTTTIRYDLPKDVNVVLKIYTMLGQEVRTLVDEKQTAGEKSVIWDGRDRFRAVLSSGIYIYRLTVDNYTQSYKMLLLK